MKVDTCHAYDANITVQGCAYYIEQDRVVLSIEQISNHRMADNLSGTLRLQFCAFPKGSEHEVDETVLASTTLGEIKDQHFLSQCSYDLIFNEPPAGLWQLVLQLSEWNGEEYVVCDSAYFGLPYRVEPKPSKPKPNQPTALTPQHSVKKNAIGCSDGYLAINTTKVDKLLSVKGIPRRVLEKLVAERPFASEKAVLNIKGIGPVKLQRILSQLLG
ncbi:helix-hairpin-helix domain-containing protein [Marinomonas sp. A79]|uniref:Helix-hairpin-helix domain-containing protein n=1 Tax=Marinomonas vulgaris TaxID=2823372 RepID=A0ABS5H9D9_9GAMM|nr:helix-hairpin-helix domain-containing protein [Marinomonas vulgaris]MBR7888047.1 helix-hairpin-helix domain-containing protein [Marinomonas vulgaris]